MVVGPALHLDSNEIARRFSLALEYHRLVEAHSGVDADGWAALLTTARVKQLPALRMCLIHPSVVPISETRWKQHRGPRIFPPLSRSGQTCWANLVWGYRCPCAANKLELDHAWPFALGGRSDRENGVWLCSLHNRAKSCDVHCYHWSAECPSWLSSMLDAIQRDVRAACVRHHLR